MAHAAARSPRHAADGKSSAAKSAGHRPGLRSPHPRDRVIEPPPLRFRHCSAPLQPKRYLDSLSARLRYAERALTVTIERFFGPESTFGMLRLDRPMHSQALPEPENHSRGPRPTESHVTVPSKLPESTGKAPVRRRTRHQRDYKWTCQRANTAKQLCSVAYSAFGNHTRQPKGNVVTDTAPICGGRVGDCRAAGVRGAVVQRSRGFGARSNRPGGICCCERICHGLRGQCRPGSRGRQRLAWMMLAIGLGAWTAGEAVWCYVSLGGVAPTSNLSVANLATWCCRYARWPLRLSFQAATTPDLGLVYCLTASSLRVAR